MTKNEFSNNKGRVWGGLFLLVIGCILLFNKMGILPNYGLFQWPMILIVIGLFLGFRQGFQGGGWLVFILIGGFYMLDMLQPDLNLKRFTFPVFVIFMGLMMMLRSKSKRNWNHPRLKDDFNHEDYKDQPLPYPASSPEPYRESSYYKPDYIDSVAVFGGVRKVIVSKNFQGGDLVSIFGGNEIDLSQADINGVVELDVTQIFGGTKLIVPAHWNVKSEMAAIFSGIEDKRRIAPSVPETNKIILLKGTSIFGGIDIRSY